MALVLAAGGLKGAHAQATPSRGVAFALLGPGYGRKVDRELAGAVIARARAYLLGEPHAAAEIRIEGNSSGQAAQMTSGNGQRAAPQVDQATRLSLRDMDVILDLALAWRLGRDKQFLRKTIAYLEAWARTYVWSFNPIDENRFDGLILGYDLVKADVPRALRTRLDAFLRQMTIWLH